MGLENGPAICGRNQLHYESRKMPICENQICILRRAPLMKYQRRKSPLPRQMERGVSDRLRSTALTLAWWNTCCTDTTIINIEQQVVLHANSSFRRLLIHPLLRAASIFMKLNRTASISLRTSNYALTYSSNKML